MGKYIFFQIALLVLLISSCSDTSTNVEEVADLPQVTIGSQIWMSQNLSVSVFRNGDPIPYAATIDEWEYAVRNGKPAYCYYNNNPLNEPVFGKMYNWYAVNDPRGLAPNGWHIPTDAEWTKLSTYLGGNEVAGGKMKNTTKWKLPNVGASNSSGFNGLPGGNRDIDWLFNDSSEIGTWWTATEATEIDDSYAYIRSLLSVSTVLDRNYYYKWAALSVRCVKN